MMNPKFQIQNPESGRSLIEMLGIMALAGVMALGAIRMYSTVHNRQARFIADKELAELAENARIIYSGHKNYAGISKSYLIKSGALKIEKIKGLDFDIRPGDDDKTFSIIFNNVDFGDCTYWAMKNFSWALAISVNGFVDNASDFCAQSALNKVEFIID